MIQKRANGTFSLAPRGFLQSFSEKFDVASMALFCKCKNSPPSLELSRVVPLNLIVDPTRQTRKHIAQPHYLKLGGPRTEYFEEQIRLTLQFDLERSSCHEGVVPKSYLP